VIVGYIITTYPSQGTVINNGDTVTLVVSKGVEMKYSNMIDVKGQALAEAKRMLLNANFIVGEVRREYHESIPEGYIISQSIEPNTSTAQKYTPVDLVVSMGPDPYAIPVSPPRIN
jgi:serine/threonine-protein kinase